MLVRLSMRRQCRAICVKRATYFSRSWRECPQRNFGREESDSVRLRRERRWRQRGRSRPPGSCCRAARHLATFPHPLYDNVTITKGKFETQLTHHPLTDATLLCARYHFPLQYTLNSTSIFRHCNCFFSRDLTLLV